MVEIVAGGLGLSLWAVSNSTTVLKHSSLSLSPAVELSPCPYSILCFFSDSWLGDLLKSFEYKFGNSFDLPQDYFALLPKDLRLNFESTEFCEFAQLQSSLLQHLHREVDETRFHLSCL